jgi:DNA mismatch repair protein MutS2
VLKPLNDPHQRAKIVIGSTVKLIETKQTGTVENCVGDAITVVFGFIRMKVEREKLSWLK